VARWAVAAALVSLGACSGPDQSTPTTRGNGVVEVTAPVTIDGVDTTPPDDPAPTGVLQGTIDPANAAFCERMIAYQDSIDFTLSSPDTAGSSNDTVRRSMEQMLAALKSTKQGAPGAVGEAVDTYAKAVQGVLNLIARHGYDMSATIQSSDGTKLKAIIDDPAVIAANQALNEASAVVCGYVPR